MSDVYWVIKGAINDCYLAGIAPGGYADWTSSRADAIHFDCRGLVAEWARRWADDPELIRICRVTKRGSKKEAGSHE